MNLSFFPLGLAVSPRSDYLYIGGRAFRTYRRNLETNELTLLQQFDTTFREPAGLAMSLDSKAIYLTSNFISRTTVFQRDSVSNELTLVQQINHNEIGGTDRLSGSRSVAVSHNGDFVYVASRFQDAGINVFSRDRETGRLTHADFYPLSRVSAMSMSPQGDHLYVSSAQNSTIESFAINHTTGNLTLVQTHHDSLEPNVHIERAGIMAFSSDGKHLYLGDDKRILTYTREIDSGALSPIQAVDLEDYEVGDIYALTISPDGAHLYGLSQRLLRFNELFVFVRNPDTGKLTFGNKQEVPRTDRIYTAIEVSPDGKPVYIALRNDERHEMIGIFSRDAVTGELSWLEHYSLPGWFHTSDILIADNGIDFYALLDDASSPGGLAAMMERSPETGRIIMRKSFQNLRCARP